ncbi:unnamed protein product [Rhizoctonia solani]|uniref:Uncharacterized protein n=1 Tax=Rhizoctonia solani TaxID=456999 RepID=A0A8H2XBG6_9AGAM|nr:unnamed protein product [Rhizoctonia solani]
MPLCAILNQLILALGHHLFYCFWYATFSRKQTKPGVWMDSAPLPMRALPVEIIALIVDEAATPITCGALIPLDATSFQPLVAAKPSFEAIRGLSRTNHWIRYRVLSRWFTTMVIREENDWDMAVKLDICTHVLELRVLSKALAESVADDVFMRFQNLHTAIIDAHNDFVPHERNPANSSQSVGYYRMVAPQLPSTLRRLWLTNAHGPDVRVIQNACAQCPQLEDLWIERCTLFSPRLLLDQGGNSQVTSIEGYDKCNRCDFWRIFPDDHDAYFASVGVRDYASSLAAELRPLKHLKRLHMGLYLTPTEAIAGYRAQHSNTNTCIHGSSWTLVCQLCTDEFGSATREAEESATTVLGYHVPNLEEISWSSFHSINKAGRSLFKIKRQSNGEVICQRQADSLANPN